MFNSNLLLSRFGEQEKKQGFLQIESAKDLYYPLGYSKGATAPLYIEGKKHFIKEVKDDKLSSELISSHIFNMLLIKSAIYLPVKHGDYSEAVSNNVIDDNCLITSVYLSELKKTLGKINPFLFSNENSFIPIDNTTRNTLATRHAIRQNLKMNAVDLAIDNWDRGYNNFGVVMKEKVFYDKGLNNFEISIKDNVIEDIVLYDNEASGWNLPHKKHHNNFSFSTLSFEEIINHYKQNEEYREYISPQELAQTVGSIQIDTSAQEVTQVCGHQFSQEYLDFLKFNVDKTAEALEHC